jgi:hypothetical protein
MGVPSFSLVKFNVNGSVHLALTIALNTNAPFRRQILFLVSHRKDDGTPLERVELNRLDWPGVAHYSKNNQKTESRGWSPVDPCRVPTRPLNVPKKTFILVSFHFSAMSLNAVKWHFIGFNDISKSCKMQRQRSKTKGIWGTFPLRMGTLPW